MWDGEHMREADSDMFKPSWLIQCFTFKYLRVVLHIRDLKSDVKNFYLHKLWKFFEKDNSPN